MKKPKKVQPTARRYGSRKEVSPVFVSYMASLEDFAKIARNCAIVQASSTGLLLHVEREDLIPISLKNNLSLECLVGDRIFLRLEDMNLEISGVVARTKLLGKHGYHIAIDYSEEAPEYWRECLLELLPAPGELD
ncbi:MAG: hypothetical protein V4736_13850 [Bdellovibrionota bacterium]